MIYYKYTELYKIKGENMENNDEAGAEALEISSNCSEGIEQFEGRLYYEDGSLKYSGGIEFISYAGAFLFNGFGEYYHNNGQLCCRGKFIEGQVTGKNMIFNSSGKKIMEGNFAYQSSNFIIDDLFYGSTDISAVLDGFGIIYYDNGKTKEKGNFLRGNLQNEGEIYYTNGNIEYKGNFKIADMYYGMNCYGHMLNLSSVFDGNGKLYYKNGKLKYDGCFLNGKYEGYGREYYENGILKYEGEFKRGLKEGTGKLYDVQGEMCKEGYFNEYTKKLNEYTLNFDYDEMINEFEESLCDAQNKNIKKY